MDIINRYRYSIYFFRTRSFSLFLPKKPAPKASPGFGVHLLGTEDGLEDAALREKVLNVYIRSNFLDFFVF